MFRFERRLAGAILRLLASDGGAPAPRRPAARTASGGGFGRGAEPPSELPRPLAPRARSACPRTRRAPPAARRGLPRVFAAARSRAGLREEPGREPAPPGRGEGPLPRRSGGPP